MYRNALLLTALVVSAAAASAEPIKLVTGNDYAPFTHSQLPEGGMTTEIVRRALEASGKEMTLSWLPWSRAFDDTKSGKFNATFPWFKTAERERDFVYSASVFDVREHGFTLPDSKLNFANPASLAGTTICLPQGWAPPAKLADMIRNGQIKREEPRDMSFCARMVANGRAHYFVTDPFQGRATIKGAGMKAGDLRMSDAALDRASLHLIVPRSSADGAALVATFNRGLETIRKSGEYDRIVERHAKAHAD